MMYVPISKADCIVHKIALVAILVAAFCVGWNNPNLSFKN